jgi:uncharacterized protein (TIGR03435 family)
MKAILGSSLVVLACWGAQGQSAGAQPEFEVASVKLAVPPAPGGTVILSFGAKGGPGTSDPERVSYRRMSLSELAIDAYAIKRFQLSGPSWLDSERFDIVAKAPPGATKEQVRLMLQNLLAERFKLTTHWEKKELPKYSLVVAKNGSKLKESAEDPVPKDGAAAPDPPPPPAGPQKLTMGKDGFPILPPGASAGPGPMIVMMNGRARMQVSKESMHDFAVTLSNQLSRQVVDETALRGKYDFILYWAPESGGPMAPPPPPPGVAPGGPTGAGPMPGSADGETFPDLFVAIQQQLGLRLEAKRGPVDILVIDHAEKAPAEN